MHKITLVITLILVKNGVLLCLLPYKSVINLIAYNKGLLFSLCTLRIQKFVETKQVEAPRPRWQLLRQRDFKIFGCTLSTYILEIGF